jgi:hypothetical protein
VRPWQIIEPLRQGVEVGVEQVPVGKELLFRPRPPRVVYENHRVIL